MEIKEYEKWQRGRVAAQEQYLARQREQKQAQVDQVAGCVERCLHTAIANVGAYRLSKAQRRRILDEIHTRVTAILLNDTGRPD